MASILGGVGPWRWGGKAGGSPYLGAMFLSQCLLTSLSFPFHVPLPIPAANHEDKWINIGYEGEELRVLHRARGGPGTPNESVRVGKQGRGPQTREWGLPSHHPLGWCVQRVLQGTWGQQKSGLWSLPCSFLAVDPGPVASPSLCLCFLVYKVR